MGELWANYNDAAFTPTFFDADLTVMFPDADKRTLAIALCNNDAATDDTPEDRRECYFDYKVWTTPLIRGYLCKNRMPEGIGWL